MKRIEFKANIDEKAVLLNHALKGESIVSSKQGKVFGNLIELLLYRTKLNQAVNNNIKQERIVEYSEEYKDKVIEHIIKVSVEEFGFEEWRESLEEMEFSKYKKDNGNFWIAINERDEVIGTLGLRNIDSEICQLKNFYVEEKYRGTGISKNLYNICMDFAETNGFKRVTLATYEKFDRAVSFYKKNGFVETGREGDAMIFERAITSNIIEIEDSYTEEGVLEYNIV